MSSSFYVAFDAHPVMSLTLVTLVQISVAYDWFSVAVLIALDHLLEASHCPLRHRGY